VIGIGGPLAYLGRRRRLKRSLRHESDLVDGPMMALGPAII